jgi:hypothetical protein
VSEPAEPLLEPDAPFIPVGPPLPGPQLPGPQLAGPQLAGPASPRTPAPAPAPMRAPGAWAEAPPVPALAPSPNESAPVAAPIAPAAVPAGPLPRTEARPASRVVSGRGVTGRGIVVLILLVTGVVGLVEVALAGHRGHAFAIAFVVTSAVGALVVRRRDLSAALIAPPLLYCILIVAMSAVDTNGGTGGLVTREGVYVGNAFVTGAPALWTGTAAAALIAWYRHRASAARTARAPHRETTPSAGPEA